MPESLIAQAGSSHGTFSCSEADVRLGLLEVIFAGDRPGIVTDFVTSTCPARVWEHTLSGVKTTQRRTTIESSRRRRGPPALVLGFARLLEHRIAEAVRLLAEAAAATRAGRAH
jgi:hypothetical protein